MRVLVVYASRLGATQGIAERIAARLHQEGLDATTCCAAKDGEPGCPATVSRDLAGFDAFVIGSAVHAGNWLDEAAAFVRANHTILASRPVWLFSSGPLGTNPRYAEAEPRGVKEFNGALSPRDHRVFFGALDRDAVQDGDPSFIERVVAKTLLPAGDFRDWEKIDTWAAGIAHQLAGSQTPRR